MTERPRPYGPYLLLKSLGTGGTGDVFLARPQDETGQVPPLVVVKRLHGQLSGQGDFLKRFKHEAQLVVAIDSPHVARVYDVGRVGDSFYIALEYVAGWPLARIIKDLEAAGHRPSMASVAEIVGGALAGLHALHTATQPGSGAALGIVHRDIAPKNIMVGEDGLTRLIDLGLGKSNLQDWKTSTGVVMGTPGYMAPEQVMGEAVDTRTDTYAMGIVLWELLTLKRYIKRGPVPLMLRAQVQPEFVPPSHRHPGVPAALDRVAARALAPDPTHRFPSADAFREALLEAVGVDDGPPAVSTLVGDLLWGELSRSKTEVTALLVNPQAEPAQFAVTAATPASFEVLAARPSDDGMPAAQLPPTALSPQPTPQDALAPPFVEMAPGRAYGTPTPMPYAGPMGSGPLPAPSGGVPPKVVAGLMLLTLALGIGVGAFLLKNRSSAPISIPTTAVRTAPAPAAAPSAAATALDVSEPPAEAATPAKAAPAHRTPHRRSKASRPAKASAPTTKTSAAPTALSLLKRVMAVRPRLVAGSKPAQSAGRLLSALQAEVSTPNPEPARIQQLARQVRALEKAAP